MHFIKRYSYLFSAPAWVVHDSDFFRWYAATPLEGFNEGEEKNLIEHAEGRQAILNDLLKRHEDRADKLFSVASTIVAALFVGIQSNYLAAWVGYVGILLIAPVLYWSLLVRTPLGYAMPGNIRGLIENIGPGGLSLGMSRACSIEIGNAGLQTQVSWKGALLLTAGRGLLLATAFTLVLHLCS